MAKLQHVYQIVDELNKHLSRDRDIKFYISERRQSLAELRSKGIVDYARIDKNNILHVYLIKNLDDLPETEWRKAIKSLPSVLESKLADKDINTRYSWSKEKYLDQTELNADIAGQWGDTPNQSPGALRLAFDKVDTANVNKLYDLADAHDPNVAVNGAKAANFIRYIKSGPTIIVPRQLWRNMGWSELAISMRITISAPELGSGIIAVLRTDFEKVVGRAGFHVTTSEAPLMHKDSLASRVDGKFGARVDLDSKLKSFYDQLIRSIQATQDYRNITKDIYSDADKRRNDYVENSLKNKLASPSVQAQIAALHQEVKDTKEVSDSIMAYYQSVVADNIKIMDQKLIQIKKHPKYDYFIIKSVSGTAIPTY